MEAQRETTLAFKLRVGLGRAVAGRSDEGVLSTPFHQDPVIFVCRCLV